LARQAFLHVTDRGGPATGIGSRPEDPMTGPTSPVQVENLGKTYPNGVEALKGVSLTVDDGEIFGLLGPNGAGKTTAIGILTTIVKPTAGRAVVAGSDVTRDPLAVRRAIGVAFQDSVLDNEFSGLENLRLHARLWGVPRRDADARIESLLDAMALTSRAKDGVRTYSGGMRRRLEIARALLSHPRIVLLDEPTVGLDPGVRHEIWNLIMQMRRQEGVTILLSTHYLEEAENVCDRVAIVHQGRLVALDTPRRLVDELGERVLEVAVEDNPDTVVKALADAGLGTSAPLVVASTVSLTLDGDAPDVDRILSRVRATGHAAAAMTVRRTTLNDAFLHLTARNDADELDGVA
jgi:ABC-2 type transport system ATP-binding protein